MPAGRRRAVTGGRVRHGRLVAWRLAERRGSSSCVLPFWLCSSKANSFNYSSSSYVRRSALSRRSLNFASLGSFTSAVLHRR